jgi:hypothetical protein
MSTLIKNWYSAARKEVGLARLRKWDGGQEWVGYLSTTPLPCHSSFYYYVRFSNLKQTNQFSNELIPPFLVASLNQWGVSFLENFPVMWFGRKKWMTEWASNVGMGGWCSSPKATFLHQIALGGVDCWNCWRIYLHPHPRLSLPLRNPTLSCHSNLISPVLHAAFGVCGPRVWHVRRWAVRVWEKTTLLDDNDDIAVMRDCSFASNATNGGDGVAGIWVNSSLPAWIWSDTNGVCAIYVCVEEIISSLNFLSFEVIRMCRDCRKFMDFSKGTHEHRAASTGAGF